MAFINLSKDFGEKSNPVYTDRITALHQIDSGMVSVGTRDGFTVTSNKNLTEILDDIRVADAKMLLSIRVYWQRNKPFSEPRRIIKGNGITFPNRILSM